MTETVPQSSKSPRPMVMPWDTDRGSMVVPELPPFGSVEPTSAGTVSP